MSSLPVHLIQEPEQIPTVHEKYHFIYLPEICFLYDMVRI